MAKNNEELKKTSSRKVSQKINRQLLEKKWHNIPIIVIGLIALLLIASSIGAIIISITNSGTKLSYEEQFQQDSLEQSDLYLNGEKSSSEVAEYWGDVAEQTDDPQEKADAYFQQYGYLQAGDNPSDSIAILEKILELESSYTKLDIYDALGGAAVVANDIEAAIYYYEQALLYFEEDHSGTEYYDAVRADYESLIAELKGE